MLSKGKHAVKTGGGLRLEAFRELIARTRLVSFDEAARRALADESRRIGVREQVAPARQSGLRP